MNRQRAFLASSKSNLFGGHRYGSELVSSHARNSAVDEASQEREAGRLQPAARLRAARTPSHAVGAALRRSQLWLGGSTPDSVAVATSTLTAC